MKRPNKSHTNRMMQIVPCKTAFTTIMTENLFQTIAIELYKQQKKQAEKEHLKFVISYIRVCVVAKTDDEVYVSSTNKIHSYFSCVLSTVLKKVELFKISKVM